MIWANLFCNCPFCSATSAPLSVLIPIQCKPCPPSLVEVSPARDITGATHCGTGPYDGYWGRDRPQTAVLPLIASSTHRPFFRPSFTRGGEGTGGYLGLGLPADEAAASHIKASQDRLRLRWFHETPCRCPVIRVRRQRRICPAERGPGFAGGKVVSLLFLLAGGKRGRHVPVYISVYEMTLFEQIVG